MSNVTWQEHMLQVKDHELAWYETGRGPTLLIVSGGPGDNHTYLRPMAEALAQRFRCVLYDQRGTGRSELERLDRKTLHVDRLVEDIEALRETLGKDSLMIMGHSWGANLALLYATAHPERVSRLALVSLGPLNDEMDAVASTNLLKPLRGSEREEWGSLSLQRKFALREGDLDRVRECDQDLMRLRVRGWFYAHDKAEHFLNFYFSTAGPNRTINQIVNESFKQVFNLEDLARVTAPVLVLYGYQDFEPIIQAYLLRDHVTQVRFAFINECGHLPWVEQPDRFYHELSTFFQEVERTGKLKRTRSLAQP